MTMTDLISRADAIEAVRVCDVFLAYQGDKIANNIDGFVDSIVEQMRDNISRAVSALPSAEGGDADMTAIPEGTGLMKPCPIIGADLISRADAIEAVCGDCTIENRESCKRDGYCYEVRNLMALPSADAVSREEYEQTDGVITIEKQSAKQVGEIKHIVIHSPNYTRYFYNESMPTSAEAVQFMEETCKLMDYVAYADRPHGEWGHMIADGTDGSYWYEYECSHCGEIVLRPYNFCPNCGANMEGGNDTTGESL